jgi:hypothetical protein
VIGGLDALDALQREPGGPLGVRHLDQSGTGGRLRVHSRDLAGAPSVVVASERMDDNPRWSPRASSSTPDRTSAVRDGSSCPTSPPIH